MEAAIETGAISITPESGVYVTSDVITSNEKSSVPSAYNPFNFAARMKKAKIESSNFFDYLIAASGIFAGSSRRP